MSNDWVSAVQSVQGIGHRKSNTVCQDKTLAIVERGVNVIALSDGAGSAHHADLGADLAVQKTCALLIDYFDSIYEKESAVIAQVIVQHIQVALGERAEELGGSIKDFAATLLFVAVRQGRYIAGHIGDGVIGFSQQRAVQVLSQPENGAYINLTYFITSKEAIEHLRIYKGDIESINGFLLLSDGSTASLYNRRGGELSRAGMTMLQWLDRHSREEVEAALLENITQWLLPKTSDDCSIAMLRRRRPSEGRPVRALIFEQGRIALRASIARQYCDNEECDYYAKVGQSNLQIADRKRGEIYCNHCRQRRSITKNSFFYRLRRKNIQRTLDCLYDLSQQDDLEGIRKKHRIRKGTFQVFLHKAAQHLEELKLTLRLNFDLEGEALVRFEKHFKYSE
ncbi:MAG: PP2C family serine/threonine-protein phosphatase [Bacteroidota bacterium]